MDGARVLVAGAGPSGLTLACGLAAQGIPVTVVDGAEGPSPTSRANILHARGVEVLTRTGAIGDLVERSLEPIGITMHAGAKPLVTMQFSEDDKEHFQALFISQALIEEELRRRLGELGVAVEWGRRVLGADQGGDGVTVAFEGGRSERFDWVVGCDGARSAVREAAGIAFPGVEVVEQFLLADVHADWDRERNRSAGWFHDDGLFLTIPMRDKEDDLWRLMASVEKSDRRLEPEDIVAAFEKLVPERSGDHGLRIKSAVWTSVFRVQRRLADDYRRGRILLAGDAAHIHSPIGGQGMNTGIGDAENLAWKLALVASGRAGEELLDTYGAERRPLATEVLKRTTDNTKLLVGDTAVRRVLRDLFFVPLLNLDAVQRRATRVNSQLWVTYRKGPLGGGGRGRGARPGDRIPDRDCTRADGAKTRLFDVLGPAWALLVPGAEGDDPQVPAVIRACLGDNVEVLHTDTDDLLLVRPDGHLAWRGTDPAEAAARLRDAFALGGGR
ncbi:FAD-dependent monooxygenase [Glycomyces tenuis]|uniref:FAD-dependent monooxygenase n=1 Tax=Glycomyces tenuis TaxID=58116 RepID=UPI000684CE31|nr:FAD-dependent monooxygenase [Glycomyces tenuis]